MFWRILFQLVRVGRARLLLALVAVVSGAAVSAALLNIHFDAESKLAREFTTLGPNVVIAARQAPGDAAAPLLEENAARMIAQTLGAEARQIAPALYLVGHVRGTPVIVAGLDSPVRQEVSEISPNLTRPGQCQLGGKAAEALRLSRNAPFSIAYGGRTFACPPSALLPDSGSELDTQIVLGLQDAQQLAGLPGKVSLVHVRVDGSTAAIEGAVQKLRRSLPDLEVRPIRQIAEAEGQILGRIRELIFATVALILVLTALCVLSSMTALAMEHRRDVGLMKALGGDMRRVQRLFLCEIVAVALAGALSGWAAGIALSAWIGRQVFAATIAPRAEVLPLILALMTAVALAGALPLRLLSRVRPGMILRGE